MGFFDSVLKVFVGDKSKKDIGELQPLVDDIKQHEAALEKLSLDELRSKTDRFREIIKEDQKEIQNQIDELQKEADLMEDIVIPVSFRFFLLRQPAQKEPKARP